MVRTAAILLALVYALLAAGLPHALHRHNDSPARPIGIADRPCNERPAPLPHTPEPVCQLCMLMATPQLAPTPIVLDLHPTRSMPLPPELPPLTPVPPAPMAFRSRGPPSLA